MTEADIIIIEKIRNLTETNKRLRAALEECRDWFAERHDGETFSDGTCSINEEMKMSNMIDHIMGWTP